MGSATSTMKGSTELELLGRGIHARDPFLEPPAGTDVAKNLCHARSLHLVCNILITRLYCTYSSITHGVNLMEGNELRLLRNRLGLTQVELAQAVDVTANTVARWERGELRVSPSMVSRVKEIALKGPSGSAITPPRDSVLDSHHRLILEGLEGHLDPKVFEACAVELVREDGWPVVHVRGGKDDGFDGSVADGIGEPFPLIVTTSRNPVKNLKQNLERVKDTGWKANRAIFVTSRPIDGGMRRRLRDAARAVDFSLVQTYGQDDLAYRLYRNPDWCKRLLGVTGRPRALSVFPRTSRPILGDAVYGREREMQWLMNRRRDCLLVGDPGLGKTFLLQSLALQGQVLFLVDGDREQIANDLRELKPRAVIIDDAHTRLDLIDSFAQLRQEVGADVRIIATSWPFEASLVRDALQISSEDVLVINTIDADIMVEIIKACGIKGPNELIAEIRKQATGRPGLATTLAHLCLAGDIKRVVSGDALLGQIVLTLNRMLDTDARRILAPFALAGNGGISQAAAAQYLGVSNPEIGEKLARLSATGIVRVRPNGSVSVEPAPLRWVLVRDVFFGGAGSLDHEPLLDVVDNQDDALQTLIGARSRGAQVSDLVFYIERRASPMLWAGYAELGPAEVEYVIAKHPELITVVAQAALFYIPDTIIPRLLDDVGKGDYDLGFRSGGPTTELRRWALRSAPTGEIEEVFHRRATLVQATERWWQRTQDHDTAIRMMCIALTPKLDYSALDPGAGMTLTIVRGVYPSRLLEQLTELWPTAIGIVRTATNVPWMDLLGVVSAWTYEDPDLVLPEETQALMRRFAERILRDLVEATREHPGVQHRLRRETERFGLDIDLTLDPEFEAVYPEMQTFAVEEHLKLASSLAGRLGSRSIEDIAGLLARIDAEARFAGMNTPSGVLSTACGRLAEDLTDPAAAVDTLMNHNLPGKVVEPFLQKAVTEDSPGWASLVRRCLDEDSYEQLAVSIIIKHPNPQPDLLASAILKAGAMLDVVNTGWLWGRVPNDTLTAMFHADDPRIAVAAAIGHWSADPKGSINEALTESWRQAFLRSALDNAHRSQLSECLLGEILANDSDLASEWLILALGHRNSCFENRINLPQEAVGGLNSRQRCSVLKALPVDSNRSFDDIVQLLVGDDLNLYRKLTDSLQLKKYHLAPLAGIPDQPWAMKAKLAMDAGYGVNDIIEATILAGGLWTGSESEMWAGWRRRFEALDEIEETDARIFELARRGAKAMSEREEQAQNRDRYRAVHGVQ